VEGEGSGGRESVEVLGGMGIAGTERLKLAELFAQGQSFWRVPVDHFTAWDSNWGAQPPDDAAPANQQMKDDKSRCQNLKSGSVIECQSQVLGENLGLTGVRFGLHYKSDRVPGRLAARTLEIPLRR